ncbi:MAG: molecular chaperone DnaK [Candidatus Taylorbacteria bacterium]|nr:molecular chaperone DnaK [Candidatus Taylorbacteria bacterium]
MSKIIGIDLGTTNSAVAVMEAGEPKILENAEGARTTPSIVAQSKTGERLVGLLAKRQGVTNPKNTIYQIKRFIGHAFDEPAAQKDKASVPFEVRKSANGGIEVKMGDPSTGSGQAKWYRPEEISAMILTKLKNDAEARLGEKITEAVITVPAYFNDSQRQATKDAGKIAGLDVKRIINEPTAAALAYGFNKKKDEKIAVFDFGGGTFDISVLEVGDDVVEVKSTDGDAHLGGKDIDQKIIAWLADEFKKESGIDVRKDALALQRLDEAAEKAKIELSTAVQTEVNIPFITSDASGPRHFLIKMTRAKLEELTAEFIDRAMAITKRAMAASPFKIDQLNEVILVGGQTRMPAMQKRVKEYFSKEPHMGVNPDEVVAVGAAIQGGILTGVVKDILLLDVIPLSFGIETLGGVATKLIEKNTTIPTSRSQVFSTAADNQTDVTVHVVQGERAMAADNKSLGQFNLGGIPPAPRGLPQIEVTFDIDANGILNVTAKDKTTGKANSIKIEARSSLSKEEVERMKKDAEAHNADDQKKREEIEIKNAAEQLIYTSEKALRDNKDKVPADAAKAIEEKISALKTAKGGNDMAAIKSASEALSLELQKIGEIMAKAAREQTASAPQSGADSKSPDDKGNDGNVREAEFKEEDKK